MSKYYGDIPCVNINNIIHITAGATSCLCGKHYTYGRPMNRNTLETVNIIWRELEAVTCAKCKDVYNQIHSNK